MDLTTFVSKSLDDLIAGVTSAKMNSGTEHFPARDFQTMKDYIQMVEFDIAVTVSTAGKTEGGGGIRIAGIGGEGKASTEAERSSVSRIKFAIPVKF